MFLGVCKTIAFLFLVVGFVLYMVKASPLLETPLCTKTMTNVFKMLFSVLFTYITFFQQAIFFLQLATTKLLFNNFSFETLILKKNIAKDVSKQIGHIFCAGGVFRGRLHHISSILIITKLRHRFF